MRSLEFIPLESDLPRLVMEYGRDRHILARNDRFVRLSKVDWARLDKKGFPQARKVIDVSLPDPSWSEDQYRRHFEIPLVFLKGAISTPMITSIVISVEETGDLLGVLYREMLMIYRLRSSPAGTNTSRYLQGTLPLPDGFDGDWAEGFVGSSR